MSADQERIKKLQSSRAYTQGMHLKKRPNFVFNADGTIKSVAKPLLNDSDETYATSTPKSPIKPPSKAAINAGNKSPFGKFSTRSGFSMSALSGKETKLAFSELGY